MSRKKITILFLMLFMTLSIVSYVLFFVLDTGQKRVLFRNPWGHRVRANWHSMRKIVNLAHLPYWFGNSELKEYDLNISSSNFKELNSSLNTRGDALDFGTFYDNNKKYVKAEFIDYNTGYQDEVKVRLRGMGSSNWEAEKKSLRIKFPKENLFGGIRNLSLHIPFDRGYYSEPLVAYRSKKLNIFNTDFEFINLNINKRDFGVYLASEHWSKELLAKKKYS